MRLGAMNDPRRDLLDEIAWIGAHGFDYIDLTVEAPGAAPESTDWATVRQAIHDAGLGVIVHAAPYLPIHSPSPLVRQAALDELRRTVDVAQVVGAPLCTMHFMGWPDYLQEKDGYTWYAQLLDILVRHGQERRVEIAMENGPYTRHQHKHFNQIFHRVPGLKLLYDVGHGNLAPTRSLTREYLFSLGDRLAHVHMSDNDGRADQHLPFGAPAMGRRLDLLQELRILRSFGYDDTITVEVFGEREWLLLSAQRIRELWPQAG